MPVQIWKAILSVVVVGLLLATLGYLVHVQADALIVGTISVALGSAIPSVMKMLSGNGDTNGKKDPPVGPIPAILVAGSILAGTSHCGIFSSPSAPKIEGDLAEMACQTVIAYAGTSDEEALCATVPELVDLGNEVRAERADAGITKKAARLGRSSGTCQIIPTQTVCATDDELFLAIVAVRSTRPRHGGVQ